MINTAHNSKYPKGEFSFFNFSYVVNQILVFKSSFVVKV